MYFGGAGQLLNTTLFHGTSALDEYSYSYDAAGHRTSVQRVDGATVNYGYDDIGEVTSAVGYEPDGTTQRANENYGYGYDPAENLLWRTNNTLIQRFESDNANELVKVTRENNVLTVAGSVSNNVTALAINGQAAALYHDGSYALAGGLPLNWNVNVFTGVVTVAGVTWTNQVTNTLPERVHLRYDLNGNLTWDGLMAYGYDDANELTSVTVTNGWRTQYQYDGLGRRRVRTDYAWLGAWVPTNGVWYVYDGMTVLQERTTNNVPLVTYTRGTDLSGSMEGAGGIGGLLARTDGNGHTYYHCDGNGNITALVNSSGTVVAEYLYDSFGNTLGMWGSLAAGNTYRFSSKEMDTRSGAYYYGYRWYQPNLQRWLNQDPIGERGGLNLYGYVGNNTINRIDPLGLADSIEAEPEGKDTEPMPKVYPPGTMPEGEEDKEVNDLINGGSEATGLNATESETPPKQVPPPPQNSGGGITAQNAPPCILYRAGNPNPGNLRERPQYAGWGLSFRSSLSNPLPIGNRPVFRPGDSYFGVGTGNLPPTSINADPNDPEHFGVSGVSSDALKDAVDPSTRGKFPQ